MKKGRIAHVLAEARASLKDPSRPLSPLGVDGRASSLQKQQALNLLEERHSRMDDLKDVEVGWVAKDLKMRQQMTAKRKVKKSKSSSSSSSSLSSSKFQINNNINNANKNYNSNSRSNSRGSNCSREESDFEDNLMFDFDLDSHQVEDEMNVNNNIIISGSNNVTGNNKDLLDIFENKIAQIERAMQADNLDDNIHEDRNRRSYDILHAILTELGPIVDQLARKYDRESLDDGIFNERNVKALTRASRVLLSVILSDTTAIIIINNNNNNNNNDLDENQSSSSSSSNSSNDHNNNNNRNGGVNMKYNFTVKQLACRQVLKLLHVPFSQFGEDRGLGISFISSCICKVTKAMYEMQQTLSDINNDNGINSHYNYDQNPISDSDIESNSLGTMSYGPNNSNSQSGNGNDEDSFAWHATVHALVDFLRSLWVRLPSDLSNDLLTGCLTAENESPINTLLQGAIYSSSVLKVYSSRSNDRRRLMVLNLVECITSGLNMVGQHSNAFVQQLAIQKKMPQALNIFRVDASAIQLNNDNTGSGSDISDKAREDKKRVMDLLGALSVQLVSVLRNFALDSNGRQTLLKTKSVCTICSLMKPFKDSPELLLSCARVVAKLSLQDNFRSQINSKPVYLNSLLDVFDAEGQACLKAGNNWPKWYTWSFLTRIAFTLGNLTTGNAANRDAILNFNKGGCLKSLLALLQACSGGLVGLVRRRKDLRKEKKEKKLMSNSSNTRRSQIDCENDESKSNSISTEDNNRSNDCDHYEGDMDSEGEECNDELELCDVIIKMLRLLANCSISSAVGSRLSSNYDLMQMLHDLIQLKDEANQTSSPIRSSFEELVLNAIAACTNITFFMDKSKITDKFGDVLIDLTASVGGSLFDENEEIILESARAIGNLSRCSSAVRALCHYRTDEALVLLSAHRSGAVRLAAVGALVNLSTAGIDGNTQSDYLRSNEGSIIALVSALRRSSFGQMKLSILICKIFYNLLHCNVDHSHFCEYSMGWKSLENTITEMVECAEEIIAEEGNNNCSDHAELIAIVRPILLRLTQLELN